MNDMDVSNSDVHGGFICELCRPSISFAYRKNLYSHKRKCHNVGGGDDRKCEKFKTELACHICDEKFGYRNSLLRHLAQQHDVANCDKVNRSRLKCPENDDCPSFKNYNLLRHHLVEHHDVKINCQSMEFENISEFKKWKTEMERQTNSFYSLNTAVKSLTNGNKKSYYNCHRSHKFVPKGNGKKVRESFNSVKTGKACPSRIEVEYSMTSFKVQFWLPHCGHTVESKQMVMDNNTRLMIAKTHKTAMNMKLDVFHVIKENEEWNVTSSSLQQYQVTRVRDTCTTPCITCDACQICIHTYHCTCVHNLVNMNICKHIHSCHLIFHQKQSLNSNNESSDHDDPQQYTISGKDPNEVVTEKFNIISELLKNEISMSGGDYSLVTRYLDRIIRVLNKNQVIKSLKQNSSVKDVLVKDEMVGSPERPSTSGTDEDIIDYLFNNGEKQH